LLRLGTGEHVIRSTSGLTSAIDVDRVVLHSGDGAPTAPAVNATAAARATVTDSTHTSRTVHVDPCTRDCWFVFGEGFNTGWKATIDGRSLGRQTQVDGGFNGWLLPASDQPRTIELTWTPQPTLTAGIILSALGVLVCVGLIAFDRRRLAGYDADSPAMRTLWGRPLPGSPYRWTSPATVSTLVALVAGTLVISLAWGVVCGVVAFIAGFLLRRPRLVGYAALLVSAYIAVVMVWRVATQHPFANAGWPGYFEDLHQLGMTVVVFVLASAVTPPGRAATGPEPTAAPH